MTNHASRILDYITVQKSVMIEYLENLVLAESPTSSPELQDQVFRLLEEPLLEIGHKTMRLDGKNSGGQLLSRPAKRSRHRHSQLLLGHCDTVWPAGTLKEMPVVIEQNKMSGPGVYDMKVGLAQIIFALKAVHDLGIELSHLPIVLITSDEELGSEDSVRQIQRLARLVDRVFIPEPSAEPEGKLKTSRKGVGAYKITLEGKAAHAGVEPDAGVSTVLELPAIIEQLHALNNCSSGVTLNIGTIRAGERINIVPARCELGIDVRVPTSEDARQVHESIHRLKPGQEGIRLRIEGGIERPPMEKTPRNQALWKLAREAARQLGLELAETSTGGGSDGNLTSPITATLDGLGGVGRGAHARHEHIYLDKMIERTALLALLLTLPSGESEVR